MYDLTERLRKIHRDAPTEYKLIHDTVQEYNTDYAKTIIKLMDALKLDDHSEVASMTNDFAKLSTGKSNYLSFMGADNTIINSVEPDQRKYLKNNSFRVSKVR